MLALITASLTRPQLGVTPHALNLTPSYCLRASPAYQLARSNAGGKLILLFQLSFRLLVKEIKLNILGNTIATVNNNTFCFATVDKAFIK
jgi:hypothetical protein